MDDFKVVSVGPETKTPATLPDLVKKADEEGEMPFEITVTFKDPEVGKKAEALLRAAGATVASDGTAVRVSGSLTKLAKEALVIASGIGIAFPWWLARRGVDPAYGSGPMATVLQDTLTILVYLAVLRGFGF